MLVNKFSNKNFKSDCRPAYSKFTDYVSKFFSSLNLEKIFTLLVRQPCDIFLFAPDDFLELSNNCCLILRFFNISCFVLDFCIAVPFISINFLIFQINLKNLKNQVKNICKYISRKE